MPTGVNQPASSGAKQQPVSCTLPPLTRRAPPPGHRADVGGQPSGIAQRLTQHKFDLRGGTTDLVAGELDHTDRSLHDGSEPTHGAHDAADIGVVRRPVRSGVGVTRLLVCCPSAER